MDFGGFQFEGKYAKQALRSVYDDVLFRTSTEDPIDDTTIGGVRGMEGAQGGGGAGGVAGGAGEKCYLIL